MSGRVKAMGVVVPCWLTTAVVGVVEVSVAGVFSTIANVTRSQRNGRLFGAMPSTKKGGEWIR